MSILDRVSFQLYSARAFPPLDNQLAVLAGIGYRNVEPYDGLFKDPAALRTVLDAHKLKTPTAHIGIDRLRADVGTVARLAKEFRIALVITPFIPPEERPETAEGWQQLGKELGGYQQALAAEGIDYAWHNHDFEFAKLPDGSCPMDHILSAAPGLKWQADIGWIAWAGEDVAAWIDKYRDRITALHVKDLAPKGENADEAGQADVGFGTIDWQALMPALEAPGVTCLVVEHDNPNDFERFARRSFATVSAW